MDLRLEAALEGNLPQMMTQELSRADAAVRAGTSKTLDWLKAELRSQIVTAFGSQRLANTWQGKFFPNKGMDAAAVVYSKAPHIIEAFSQATVIVSAGGFWLAIPSPDCPKGSGGSRVTPSNFPEDRFGKLRFVYRAGRSSLLVVDEVGRTASGKVSRQRLRKKDGSYKAGTVSVVMFYLVPKVRLKQRIDPQGAYDEALTRLVDNVIEEWNADGAQG